VGAGQGYLAGLRLSGLLRAGLAEDQRSAQEQSGEESSSVSHGWYLRRAQPM
jgi:hypothetical protein